MAVTRGQPKPHYPVAIVGGGIAGLTLALAFERLGIDYALFEAYDSLAPNEGASIGLLPNGLRMLDQLGLLENIESNSAALQSWRHVRDDGSVMAVTNALGYYGSKIGYGGLFLERQKLLQIMSDQLQRKGLIQTSARISSVEEKEDYAVVTTHTGLSITADLVIGADGVRSVVRRFIGSSQTEQYLQVDDCMTARFACVYGISNPTVGIEEGDCFSVYRESATILGFTGKGGVIFWFVFEDLGRVYGLSESPRYDAGEVEAVCMSVADLAIYPSIRFEHIYGNRKITRKIALEEGIAKTWNTGRTVIVGDAAHKMVPNAAMGANQAIESSAILVNELQKIWEECPDGRFNRERLNFALNSYSRRRVDRARETMQRAGGVCRAQLCHGGLAAAIREQLPNLSDGDWLFRGFMSFAEAPIFDALPLTSRGLTYQRAVEAFQAKVEARERGELPVTNTTLMGLDGIHGILN